MPRSKSLRLLNALSSLKPDQARLLFKDHRGGVVASLELSRKEWTALRAALISQGLTERDFVQALREFIETAVNDYLTIAGKGKGAR